MIISQHRHAINPRLTISTDPRGWQSVSLNPLSDRHRAPLALASVRNRRRLGIRPAVTPSDIAAVRAMVDVQHAVRLVDDGGD